MIELLLQFIGDFDGYSHNAKSLIVHMETCQIVAMVHVPVSASIRNPHPFQAIALPGAAPYLAAGLLREYDSEDMKVKTSVTLSEALLKAISAESNIENRSDFIESAVWMYLERLRLRERDRLEIERINANAAFLNAEGGEAGEFQNE